VAACPRSADRHVHVTRAGAAAYHHRGRHHGDVCPNQCGGTEPFGGPVCPTDVPYLREARTRRPAGRRARRPNRGPNLEPIEDQPADAPDHHRRAGYLAGCPGPSPANLIGPGRSPNGALRPSAAGAAASRIVSDTRGARGPAPGRGLRSGSFAAAGQRMVSMDSRGERTEPGHGRNTRCVGRLRAFDRLTKFRQ
jgi:hypothetical protein